MLKAALDLERALSRISLGRGGPRDIAAIRYGLVQGTALRDTLVAEANAPTGLTEVRADLGTHEELIDRLCRALDDDLPLLTRRGFHSRWI